MTSNIPPANGSSELLSKDHDREAFRQCLRRADKLILENKFDEARAHLVEAAKLNPTHPMIDVFAERLDLARRTSPAADTPPSGSTLPAVATAGLNVAPSNGSAMLPGTAQPSGQPRKAEPVQTEPELAKAPLQIPAAKPATQPEPEQPALHTEPAQPRIESQAQLLREYESMRQQYEELKASLQESSARQQSELKADADRQLQEQLEHLRKREQEMNEQQVAGIRQDVEAVLRSEYDRKMVLLGTILPKTKEEQASFYRERIRPSYVEGKPSVEEEQTIVQLRQLLQLAEEEYHVAESDVRLERYVEVVEERILAGELNLANPLALEELKNRYRLTPEESSRLESRILSKFQQLAFKGRILLVDDDPTIRTALGRILTDSGYQVVESPDILTALEKLEDQSIDLILSDVRFATGELDGFKFFKTVLDQSRSHSIPFLLMSGLDDGVIIRSGMQMGVDDYLIKPIDPDLLLAVVEGKMKRYKTLH